MCLKSYLTLLYLISVSSLIPFDFLFVFWKNCITQKFGNTSSLFGDPKFGPELGYRLLFFTLNSLQEVEPMYKESDHIHIIALSSALDVGIRVRYMDRGQSTEAIAHDFPEGSHVRVHLLYRPGHYDILYPNDAD